MKNKFYVKSVDSTNELLWKMSREYDLPEGFVVYTDFQNAGKGQVGNKWESANKKNILFSMLLKPEHVPVGEQFFISQIVSVAIKRVLEKYNAGFTIKWPNDIYWNNQKIAGILIENSLQGNKIKYAVVGVGVNINQKIFESDAPNPVSLFQITNRSHSRSNIQTEMSENIIELYKELNVSKIRNEYMKFLYRKEGYYLYKDDQDTFSAKIIDVHSDGQLELEEKDGNRKTYYFKEVQFLP